MTVRKYRAISGLRNQLYPPEYLNSSSVEYIISGTTVIKPPKDMFTHFNQSAISIYAGVVRRK
jgi:hypothetical protein